MWSGSGFDPAALSHSYGMAEGTAKITAERPGRRGTFAWLDAAALERGLVRDASPGARGVAVAGNGITAGETRVAIVDPESGKRAAPDRIGEIWVSGPSVGRGYWGRPEETEVAFGARIRGEGDRTWLRTGDLGFVRDGQLFVSGRQKDLIIVRGENHHPHDIEWSVRDCHPALRPGSLVAFAVDTEDGEALGLVAEVYPEQLGDPEVVFGALRDAVAGHGLAAALLALAPPGSIEKTSSGKPRRQEIRRLLTEDELPVLARFDAGRPDRSVLRDVDLPAVLRATRDADRGGVLLLHARQLAAGMLGLPLAAVDGARPLKELGLDSITQIEMIEQLAARLGIELPGSTVRDHPTLAGVTKAALARFGG
jgi:nonribosomal peptide synthetase protein BlmVI